MLESDVSTVLPADKLFTTQFFSKSSDTVETSCTQVNLALASVNKTMNVVEANDLCISNILIVEIYRKAKVAINREFTLHLILLYIPCLKRISFHFFKNRFGLTFFVKPMENKNGSLDLRILFCHKGRFSIRVAYVQTHIS